MRILYLSSTFAGILSKGIYSDLMQEFKNHGHDVTVAYAKEQRLGEQTSKFELNGIQYLGIKTMDMSKNKNLIKKGIATITFDRIFKKNIAEFLDEDFDVILYSTPPVNLIKTLSYLKDKNPSALTYLMLKDVFPQNAIDLNLIRPNGIFHRYFKRKERKLYNLSDQIGVMSQANKDFVLRYCPYLEEKIEILPNTITLESHSHTFTRKDFGLPEDKVLLLYGGNLGLPQAVPFILECYEKIKDNESIALVIAGSGAQDELIKDFIKNHKPKNLHYFDFMEQPKYTALTSLCDVGLVFLDYRFTVPNYPQRILSYLENKLPVICATDPNTDIGKDAEVNGYGIWVPSNDSLKWYQSVDKLANDTSLRKDMGLNGYTYLVNNFQSNRAYKIIMAHVEDRNV